MGKLKALFNLKKYAFDSGDEITTFFIKQFVNQYCFISQGMGRFSFGHNSVGLNWKSVNLNKIPLNICAL